MGRFRSRPPGSRRRPRRRPEVGQRRLRAILPARVVVSVVSVTLEPPASARVIDPAVSAVIVPWSRLNVWMPATGRSTVSVAWTSCFSERTAGIRCPSPDIGLGGRLGAARTAGSVVQPGRTRRARSRPRRRWDRSRSMRGGAEPCRGGRGCGTRRRAGADGDAGAQDADEECSAARQGERPRGEGHGGCLQVRVGGASRPNATVGILVSSGQPGDRAG